MEQRANIKFWVKLEKKFVETYELMEEVYGDDCMSRTEVYTWFTRFKNFLRLGNSEVLLNIFHVR